MNENSICTIGALDAKPLEVNLQVMGDSPTTQAVRLHSLTAGVKAVFFRAFAKRGTNGKIALTGTEPLELVVDMPGVAASMLFDQDTEEVLDAALRNVQGLLTLRFSCFYKLGLDGQVVTKQDGKPVAVITGIEFVKCEKTGGRAVTRKIASTKRASSVSTRKEASNGSAD